MRILLAVLPLLFAPPSPAGGGEPSAKVDESYDQARARADVELILSDRGRAYLDARARLEANPVLAAEAVMARLEAVPAPGPDQRNRLLNVLAALGQPEHVAMFADQLRIALIQGRPVDLWLELLRRQGAAAAPALLELVGDRELSNQARGDLLELLVELTARDQLGALLASVGRGAEALQDRLRRAVISRAHRNSRDAETIAASLDTALDADPGDERRTAQLLILRAACCQVDEGFVDRLRATVADDAQPFQVRVAAIDGLRRLELGGEELAELARRQAPAAGGGSQSAEILLALALDALPRGEAEALASELALVEADAPRLAELGYRYAKLGPALGWLEGSQDHAWPQVRRAALARVAEAERGCDKLVVRKLSSIAGPISRGGDEDARVGRSAVAAMGRCGGPLAFKQLRELLEDTAVAFARRAEAARQLVVYDPAGPNYVAELLLDGRYPDLARDLASSLRRTPEPTPTVRTALCLASRGNPMVASTAYDSFAALYPGERCED